MDGGLPSAHQLYLATKKPFRDLEIPPRKLLLTHRQPSMEETLFQKFLPYNNPSLDDDDDDSGSDPYASDHFRIYEFKIRKCTRSRSHDWTDCPFAHPGEKARRRCPRRFGYSGTVCADFRRGSCARGDSCEFAHGVFECWLHPSRYRTEACKDGKNCQRKICFFAHTPGQLRSLSPPETVVPTKSGHCVHCRCHPGIHHTNSPTSILEMEKLSPPASPPFSPVQTGFSPISRFRSELTQLGKDSKNDLMSPQSINELMQSMRSMNMNSFIGNGGDDQSLFAFSPSTSSSSPCGSGSGRVFVKECNLGMNNEEKLVNGAPDLDWVDDLLT